MKNIAFLFVGQGAQSVGMGEELYNASDEIKKLFEISSEITGENMTELIFNGPQEKLTESKNAQPSLLLVAYSAYILIKDKIPSPKVYAGHSLGEYTALTAAGVLSFEKAIFLVRKRGELMSSAGVKKPGKMAAIIGLNSEKIDEICESIDGIVVPANYNTLAQTVISGDSTSVEKAGELCKINGAKRVIYLDVSAAFHSPLMKEASSEFSEILDSVEFKDSKVPIIVNAFAKSYQKGKDLKNALKLQMSSPVKWTQTILKLKEMNIISAIEFAPKPVLSGMIRKIERDIRVSTVSDIETMENVINKYKQ